jgi:hypothetical protein
MPRLRRPSGLREGRTPARAAWSGSTRSEFANKAAGVHEGFTVADPRPGDAGLHRVGKRHRTVAAFQKLRVSRHRVRERRGSEEMLGSWLKMAMKIGAG